MNLTGSFKTRSNNHKLSSKNNDPESELSRFSKVHATNASSIGHIKSQGKGTALYLSSGVPGVFTSWPNSKVIIERELISTNYWKSLSSGSPSPNPETILIALDHIVATQERQRITLAGMSDPLHRYALRILEKQLNEPDAPSPNTTPRTPPVRRAVHFPDEAPGSSSYGGP